MEQVTDFINIFTDKRLDGITKIRNGFFVFDDHLTDIKNKIKKEIFSGGSFIGELKNNRFMPSTTLIDWLSQHSDRKLFVNRKTAWLFLCDRDIFAEGIVRSNAKEGLVLVQNEADENLGYGKITGEFGRKGKVAVENLLDKGDFLRREH